VSKNNTIKNGSSVDTALTPLPQSPQHCHASVHRVGVVGGGQLAGMMAAVAPSLDLSLIIQTPHTSDPAVAVAHEVVLAEVADASATAELAGLCDVITFENEFVDLEALSTLVAKGVCFRPSLTSLAPLLDKYHQRQLLQTLGLPTPKFEAIALETVSSSHLIKTGKPVVLKARRHGYDGQGTFIMNDKSELEARLKQLSDQPLLVEEFIPFERELAVIVARSSPGEIVTYPVVETQQENQVCRRVFAPANLSPQVGEAVNAIARRLLDSLQVVGVFGIELFLTQDGNVLVNEIAPRTHNSGHYTIEACVTSQFEQHLRAVSGLPLGSTALVCPGAVMVNLLGYETAESDYLGKRQQLAEVPNAYVHWYGKTQSRPGRKLGHVTVLLDEPNEAQALLQQVETRWYES
jgi:5-(carboxyamino)imidazole ribonucleotide synthase